MKEVRVGRSTQVTLSQHKCATSHLQRCSLMWFVLCCVTGRTGIHIFTAALPQNHLLSTQISSLSIPSKLFYRPSGRWYSPPTPGVTLSVPSIFHHLSYDPPKFPLDQSHADPQHLPLSLRACLHRSIVITISCSSTVEALCIDWGGIRIGFPNVMEDFPWWGDWFGLAGTVTFLHTMRENVLNRHWNE